MAFDDAAGAVVAKDKLHGRSFDGKSVAATFFDPEELAAMDLPATLPAAPAPPPAAPAVSTGDGAATATGAADAAIVGAQSVDGDAGSADAAAVGEHVDVAGADDAPAQGAAAADPE